MRVPDRLSGSLVVVRRTGEMVALQPLKIMARKNRLKCDEKDGWEEVEMTPLSANKHKLQDV